MLLSSCGPTHPKFDISKRTRYTRSENLQQQQRKKNLQNKVCKGNLHVALLRNGSALCV